MNISTMEIDEINIINLFASLDEAHTNIQVNLNAVLLVFKIIQINKNG